MTPTPRTPKVLKAPREGTIHKVCSGCHRLKPVGAFHRDPSKRDGRRGRCGECETAARPSRAPYMKAYHEANHVPKERECARCGTRLAVGSRTKYCASCRKGATKGRSGATWHGFKPETRACAECGDTFVARAPHAKFCSGVCRTRKRQRERPTMESRGYGRDHFALRAQWAREVARGLVSCARCGDRIAPGERWDLDHDDNDRSQYLGPSHARCNRATARHRVEREQLITSRDW